MYSEVIRELHQGEPCARSLKLAHHSFNKVQHFFKICGTDATRAINQEHDVLVLLWTLLLCSWEVLALLE